MKNKTKYDRFTKYDFRLKNLVHCCGKLNIHCVFIKNKGYTNVNVYFLC